jgi:hypothetical protein
MQERPVSLQRRLMPLSEPDMTLRWCLLSPTGQPDVDVSR